MVHNLGCLDAQNLGYDDIEKILQFSRIIFDSIYKTENMKEIKDNMRAWFAPQPVEVSRLKLALGSLFMPDIKLDDHNDKAATTTFSTIADFMEAENLAEELLVVSNDAPISSLSLE